MAIEFQRLTLEKSVEFGGLGLHSGEEVKVRIDPSDHGIVFHCGPESVIANPDNVTDTSRCTRLGGISTIEHLMSAFSALGITDASVILSKPEMPALGGNSIELFDGLASAGIDEIGKATLHLFERVFFIEDPIRIGISKGAGHWSFEFACDDRWPNSQTYEINLNKDEYRAQVAPARTFAFEEEIEPIRQAGLARGLDESSALILGKSGYINSPKFPDEPARHKLLDLMGDLYLSGVPAKLINVSAVRSGHRTNVEAAKRLAAHARVVTV